MFGFGLNICKIIVQEKLKDSYLIGFFVILSLFNTLILVCARFASGFNSDEFNEFMQDSIENKKNEKSKHFMGLIWASIGLFIFLIIFPAIALIKLLTHEKTINF